jgi:NAD(P)-dependent dehydrogenase (short-subunit alcohol dehydrogenase family)
VLGFGVTAQEGGPCHVDWSEMGSTADLEAAGRVMQVNLFGSWRMIQAFLPLLKRSAHPRIVNVSRAAPAPTPIRPSASHSEAARQRRMESAKLL